MGQEKGETFMSYLNSVTIIGFVGADPEQRQARNNNGSKFTVLSVATQRSWKNTDDEWVSKTECLPSATGRTHRNGDQERRASPRRGRALQPHLRAPARQEQDLR